MRHGRAPVSSGSHVAETPDDPDNRRQAPFSPRSGLFGLRLVPFPALLGLRSARAYRFSLTSSRFSGLAARPR
jgi:hypothetical protein